MQKTAWCYHLALRCPGFLNTGLHTEKSKTRFWGNATQKPRAIFLEHILRPIRKPISSLPDHFGTSVKKNIPFLVKLPWLPMAYLLCPYSANGSPCAAHRWTLVSRWFKPQDHVVTACSTNGPKNLLVRERLKAFLKNIL